MRSYRRLLVAALLLTAVVVVFGAYVRLSDAGLGCPDWPGCYGKLSPHHAAGEILQAHEADPHGPVSLPKAWKEMIHRYLAAGLGLGIVAIAVLGWRLRTLPGAAPGVAAVLVGVVAIQGLLGKWTVTLLLKPAIVTAHLLGGLTVFGLLLWLCLRAHGAKRAATAPALRGLARLGLALLAVQIALGGWTSTNYAALACSGFPACNGAWWPQADYANAFHVVRELGMTAEGEVLPVEALVAIHWIHRLGAAVVGGVLIALGVRLAASADNRGPGWAVIATLALQVILGIANVLLGLPLTLAVAHNAGVLLLVGTLVWVNYRLAPEPAVAPVAGRIGVVRARA